ncbi:zinc knuckle transcription factor [Penicillium vulpinum]|uniref:zinc knuckle transcription factor n=1 Tax=Penicillium vulpinum TaxID=29845 RepID=UPI0025485A98|nr:zinc knuckle transcription factor [Penicillium vulpinum]KAJ5959832.1 zinc knuckle transcription factor [Penicillium vulpinum]
MTPNIMHLITPRKKNGGMKTSEDENEDESEDESEDPGCEQEDIEDHEYSTSGDATRTLKIRLFLADEEVGEFKWMENFVAKCTLMLWMEEPSEDMCDVAFHVFDRYGTVETKYKDHPVQRGTGVWGNELDHGPIFLIEKLHVTLELRRKGLGQKVVSLLLKKAQQFSLDNKGDGKYADSFYGSNEAFEQAWTLHALVNPGYLTADVESQLVDKSAEERVMILNQIQSGGIDFWRSCGFRRIGASRCFAFSFDLQHQSRALTAASDFDPRSSHAEELEYEEVRLIYETDRSIEVKRLKIERLREPLPLHYAALTLTDEELKAFFITHATDKIGWDRVTNSAATLLHLIACKLKPLSTQWLLENAHQAEFWNTARDIDGYTPLEALQEKLEKIRTRKAHGFMTLNLSDHFKGNSDTAVTGVHAEKGEIMYDLNQEGIDHGGFWIDYHDDKIVHLDSDVRNNPATNKSFRQGFVNIFQIAAECLQAKRVPTAENLEWCCNNRSEWPPVTKNYLRRAGTQMGCRAVLRYMFDAAKMEDEKAGDG